MQFLALSFAALLMPPPTRALPTAGPFDYESREIAPSVYEFFETRLNPIVSSNVIAVIGTESVLVFDTGHHPQITRKIISDIKRITDKPVRYVVVSHWHDDHWVGNEEFAKAFPNAQVIAHGFTADRMNDRKAAFRSDACKTELIDQSKPLRERLASGKRADGTPLTEATRQRLQNFIEAFDVHLGECDEMVFRGADRRVDKSLTLDLGGRHVELKFLGRANTAGDLVAYLPESKTVLTGDVVVHPFPFATHSYISEWAKVLRALERMDVTRIVPGHGPVLTDKQYIRDLAEVFETIEKQARAAYYRGMTADQLREKIDVTALAERFSHGEAFIRANFDAQMQSAVDRMWQELSGEWKPEGN